MLHVVIVLHNMFGLSSTHTSYRISTVTQGTVPRTDGYGLMLGWTSIPLSIPSFSFGDDSLGGFTRRARVSVLGTSWYDSYLCVQSGSFDPPRLQICCTGMED